MLKTIFIIISRYNLLNRIRLKRIGEFFYRDLINKSFVYEKKGFDL